MPMHHDFPRSTTRVSWTGQGATANTNVTIEVSFYLDALSGGTGMYLWHNECSSGSFSRFVAISAGDKLQIGIGDAGGGVAQYLSNESVVAGRWYHVVFVITSDAKLTPGNCKIYVKGGGFTFTDSGGSGTAENADGTTYTVGNRATDGARGLDGRIRRPRVWNNLAMSAGRVNEIFDGVETTVPVPNFAPDENLLAGVVAGSVTGSVVKCDFGDFPTDLFAAIPPIFYHEAEDLSVGAISAWPDRARNVVTTQGTAANQPVCLLDAGDEAGLRKMVRVHGAYGGGGLSARFMSGAGNGAVAPVIDRRFCTVFAVVRARTCDDPAALLASSGDHVIVGPRTNGFIGAGTSVGAEHIASSACLVAISLDAAEVATFQGDEATAALTALAVGSANGFRLFQDNAGTSQWEGFVYAIGALWGPLTQTRYDQLLAHFAAKYPIPVDSPIRTVVMGSSTPTGWNDWDYFGWVQLAVDAFQLIEWYNVSQPGWTYADTLPATREDTLIRADKRMVGIKAWASNYVLIGGGGDVATLKSTDIAYAGARRTAGYDVIGEQLFIPRDFGGGTEASHITRINDVGIPYIASVKANELDNDFYLDPSLDSAFDNFGLAGYAGADFTTGIGVDFADSSHANTPGHVKLFNAFFPTLNQILLGPFASSPSLIPIIAALD